MIITINGIEHTIPEGWHQVNWKEYILMPDPKDAYSFAAIRGIPMPLSEYVIHLLDFLQDNMSVKSMNPDHAIDITDRSWLDYELAMNAYNSEEDSLLSISLLASHYLGIEVLELSVPEALPIIEHFNDQMAQINQTYGHIDFDRFLDEKDHIARLDDKGNDLFEGFHIESQMEQMGYRPDEYATKLETIPLHTVLRDKLFRFNKAHFQYNRERLNKHK